MFVTGYTAVCHSSQIKEFGLKRWYGETQGVKKVQKNYFENIPVLASPGG